MKKYSTMWLIAASIISIVAAQDSYFFPNGTFNPDTNVSTTCASALQAPIDCLTDVMTIATTDTFFPYSNNTYKDTLCNKNCGSALKTYVRRVQGACANDPQPFTGLPATYYGNFAWASWNLTCLQDPTSGKYCIEYFFNIFDKYSQNASMELAFSDLGTTDLCVPCTTLMFQQIQGTPFSNYDAISADDWAAVQKKCGLSYPTAVPSTIANSSVLSGYQSDEPTVTASCLSGNTYTVSSGDTAESIAKKTNVATGTLIVLNNLLPDASDLQGGQVLCLPQSCQTYRVSTNDTCYSIATANNFTYPMFLAYNPTIDEYCTNLILGRTVCISAPGGMWDATTIAGATATQTNIYATTTVSPPGPTASGTTSQCGKYYLVQPGDYCQLVALNQSVSLTLFEAINPSVNSGCTNLVAGLYYCLAPLETWNASAAVSSTLGYISAPAPTPSGTTRNCYEWYTVQSGNTCYLIESSFGITMDQLMAWNPAIKSDCSNLVAGDAYCVNADDSASPSSPTTNSATPTRTSASTSSLLSASTIVPAPTSAASGTTKNCFKWYAVRSGNVCYDIDSANGITFAQFRAWNPSVDAGCSNIIPGVAYCVSSSDVIKTKRDKIEVEPVWKEMLPPKFPGVDRMFDEIAKGRRVAKRVVAEDIERYLADST